MKLPTRGHRRLLTWQLWSIDCLSATTCWLAGDDTSNGVTPVLLETTDGGADWTTFTNLPGITRYDPGFVREFWDLAAI